MLPLCSPAATYRGFREPWHARHETARTMVTGETPHTIGLSDKTSYHSRTGSATLGPFRLANYQKPPP
jgi:hypothetical protein